MADGAPATGPGRAYIGQGEYAVGRGRDEVIATLLGSCVSACLWDPGCGVGGMNHVLFTDEAENAACVFGHGVNGMELLINGLTRLGARKPALKAKVFGGATMISGLTDAGARNGAFVLEFLAREGIEHVGGDLGGHLARRVEFWPATGRARMKRVQAEIHVAQPPGIRVAQEVELF